MEQILPRPSVNYNLGPTSKKHLVFLIAGLAGLVLIVAISVWLYSAWKPSIEQPDISQEAAKGTLPSISNNPLENKPNINPAEKTNPMTGIKTNPFE